MHVTVAAASSPFLSVSVCSLVALLIVCAPSHHRYSPFPPPLPGRRCCCSPGNPRDPLGEESSPGAAPRQVHGGRAVWGRPRGRAWTQPPCVLQVAQRSLRGALFPSSCCTATVPGQPCPLQGRRWRRVQSQHRVPSALPRQRTHVACGAAPFPLTNSLCSRSRNKCPSPCPVPTALLGALHKVGPHLEEQCIGEGSEQAKGKKYTSGSW
jgi:hypothetical protein